MRMTGKYGLTATRTGKRRYSRFVERKLRERAEKRGFIEHLKRTRDASAARLRGDAV